MNTLPIQTVGKKHAPALLLAGMLLAGLLAAASMPASSEETLGRLFYTPQQRAQLDYGFARNATAEGSSAPVITVNGIVQKDGGPRTVWINGVAQSSRSRGNNPSSQTVNIPGKSRSIQLKVGEKILLEPAATESAGSPGNLP